MELSSQSSGSFTVNQPTHTINVSSESTVPDVYIPLKEIDIEFTERFKSAYGNIIIANYDYSDYRLEGIEYDGTEESIKNPSTMNCYTVINFDNRNYLNNKSVLVPYIDNDEYFSIYVTTSNIKFDDSAMVDEEIMCNTIIFGQISNTGLYNINTEEIYVENNTILFDVTETQDTSKQKISVNLTSRLVNRIKEFKRISNKDQIIFKMLFFDENRMLLNNFEGYTQDDLTETNYTFIFTEESRYAKYFQLNIYYIFDKDSLYYNAEKMQQSNIYI